jgi:hypothetical protein
MRVINCPQERRRGSLKLKTTVSESVRQMGAQLHCMQGNSDINFIVTGVILKKGKKQLLFVLNVHFPTLQTFFSLGKKILGRRQILLIWLRTVCTVCFVQDCQLHTNIL